MPAHSARAPGSAEFPKLNAHPDRSSMLTRRCIPALHSHPALFVAFRPLCLRLQRSHAAASTKLFSVCDDFLPWLQRKADQEISLSLSIGDSICGRYIFASKSIQAGECILRVPYKVQLTADKAIPGLALVENHATLSDIGQLAVAILEEKKLGWKSEWAPYINSLPLLEQMHNTALWSDDDLNIIQLSSVYSETIRQKEAIKQDFFMALKIFPQILYGYELKDFSHACSLVGSRAWGTTKGIAMIPFADFMNHNGRSDSVLLHNDDKQISEVIADRDYSYGEEVLIRYGKFSNAILLVDFGFTLPNNVHDQVEICLSVPPHDPLYSQKLELLHTHKMLTSSKTKDVQSSKISFTIKEVRSAQGTGKGIPQALRAFARILSTSSSKELKDLELEAAASDGRLARLPLKNKNQEIQAHHILLSHIKTKIKDYNTSIKALAAAVCSKKGMTASSRKEMSLNLLTGELRVLQSACLWLKNYCDRLSS